MSFDRITFVPGGEGKILEEWVDSVDTDILGIDCETTSLNVWSTEYKLRMVQLSDGETAVCVQVEGNEDVLRMILGYSGFKFISHTNIDALFIEHGLAVNLKGRVLDTYLLAVLLSPSKDARHGLKHLTETILGTRELVEAEAELHVEFKRGIEIMDAKVRGKNKINEWGFKNVPIDNHRYVTYAGLDAIYVHRLAKTLLPQARALLPGLWELEHWISDECLELRERGLKLDVPRTQALHDEAKTEMKHARERLESIWGFPAFSPKRAEWLLQHGAEFDPDQLTAKGEPSLCKEHIETLSQTHTTGLLGQVIGDMRTLSTWKNLASNVNILLEKQTAGRVHPNVRTLRAVTGRMSITEPAMQTYKKQDKRLRGLFIADEGMSLVACDFAQVEIRVAAALSKDERLTSLIVNGEDIHSATAKEIWGDDFTDEQRQLAKIVNFGSIYGGGAKALSHNSGIDEAAATSIVLKWRQVYPGLVAYGKALSKQSMVTNYAGRRLPIDPERRYSALNYMIQSSARDLFVETTKRVIDNLELSNNLWLLVHDELLFQVPAGEAESWAMKIKAEMEFDFQGIPIEADATILGERWSGE